MALRAASLVSCLPRVAAAAGSAGSIRGRRALSALSVEESVAQSSLFRNPNLDMVDIPPAADEPWQVNVRGDGSLVGERSADWWTGKAPEDCPGMGVDGKLRSLPLVRTDGAGREAVRDYFDNTWTLTELLFAGLQGEEAFYRPPYHALRHPMVFYYGHPASLYVNKLVVAGLRDGPLDAKLEHVFETGVDEMSWDDLSKNEMLWPAVSEVRSYRAAVYESVQQLIDNSPQLDEPIGQDDPLWALFLGFEHERIHLETSSVLMREMPRRLLRAPAAWPDYHPSAYEPSAKAPKPGVDYPSNELVSVAGGTVSLGKPDDYPSFGWDNEYGSRDVTVPSFRSQKYLVSNGEYWQFVADGGYRDETLWTEEGWRWRTFRNAKWPTFWVPDGPQGSFQFNLRALFGVVDMPWSWPADINLHEVKAYAAWLSRKQGDHAYRVVTEAESVILRGEEDSVLSESGESFPASAGRNLNLPWSSSSPVDAMPAEASGVHDAAGNVWQWAEDHFNPLTGFSVHPVYDDFSTPCFDGKHNIIMGGSWISTGQLASRFARYHFRPHFFQHAGGRLVACDAVADIGPALHLGENVYETDKYVNEYLAMHFATMDELLSVDGGPVHAASFPSEVAKLARQLYGELATGDSIVDGGRALEVGCAVGRTAFELARDFGDVHGFDLSAAFINAANVLKADGSLPFTQLVEGELTSSHVATVDSAIDRSRVSFRVGDACCLPPELPQYDLVVLANTLCRLPNPTAITSRVSGEHGLVRPGGILLVTSPFSWLPEFTQKDLWLGGYLDSDGNPVHSADGLRAELEGSFELVDDRNVPFIIREHQRKFQYVIAHTTAWRKKE